MAYQKIKIIFLSFLIGVLLVVLQSINPPSVQACVYQVYPCQVWSPGEGQYVDGWCYACQDTNCPPNYYWATDHCVPVGGGGGGGCFPAGTKVLMSTGGLTNIENVQVGDTVVSESEAGQKSVSTVSKLETPISNNLCKINYTNGDKLDLTRNHPIFTSLGWKAIDPEAARAEIAGLDVTQLKTGDMVKKADDSFSTVSAFTCNAETIQTYNLRLDDGSHTYFADNFLVHNKAGGCPGGCCAPNPQYYACGQCGNPPCCDANAWGACSTSCGWGTQINACGTVRACNNYACVPKGTHDSSSCTASLGWACDQDNYNTALSVSFYTGGTLLGSTTANLTREPAVGTACGGNTQHGFSFNTPFSLWDGAPHAISAYAANIPSGSPFLLSGSPKTITCIALPWWQVKDADVQSAGDITSQVASGSMFNLDGQGGFPGIPVYAGTTNITPANVSTKGWLVNSTPVGGKVYTYDYFANLVPTDITAVMNAVNTSDVPGSLTSGSATADTNNYYWYKYDGAVNSNQPLTIPATNIGTRKVILLVDNANVNITGNINLTDGVGLFMLIVKGSINVDLGVGGGATPNLEGLYMADTSFSDGAGSSQLWLRGSLVANGGIALQRDLGAAGNATPAELFEYAPDQIMLFPKILGTRRINWKEVAP